MIYTIEQKKKLDAILKAFEDYIDEQNYFDIVYSKKIGYVWIVVDRPIAACMERLNTPEAMLDHLFNEVINDVVFSQENPNRAHEELALTEYEETESRRRITAILETIEDGADEYLGCLDGYLKDYQERCRGDDES